MSTFELLTQKETWNINIISLLKKKTRVFLFSALLACKNCNNMNVPI